MENLLKSALQEYKDQFGQDFDPGWTPSTEKDLADQLQASKINFETWRAKHQKIWHSLSACAKPLGNIGKMVWTAGSNSFPPAAAAISGMVSLVAACEDVSEAYDFIEEMFAKLEDTLGRWEIDFRSEVDDYLMKKMQEIMVLILSIIARSRKLIRRGRVRVYFRTLALGKDEKISELMDNLTAALKFEDRARATLSLDKINALWEKSIQTENAQVIERLRDPIGETNERLYAEKVEEMVSSTGSWIEQEPLYQRWIQGEFPLLLLLGGPGSGKSFVATSIIANLVEQYRQITVGANHRTVGYFFINKDVNLTMMLKALAYQLQTSDPAYRDFLIDVFESGNIYTARQIWKKLFAAYWTADSQSPVKLFLVIDGLDEMNGDDIELFAQEMIHEMLKEGMASGRIHICISGRESLLANFEFIPKDMLVRTDSTKNQADMAAYIMNRLEKVRSLKKATPELRSEYCDQILQSCDGIFEWARLLIEKCKDRDKKLIKKLIDNPPKSLDDMIESCFEQIVTNDEIDPDALSSLFTWLTYSKRPLTFGELYNMVSLSTKEEHPLLWFHVVKHLSSLVRWRSTRSGQIAQDEQFDGSLEELNEDDNSWSKDLNTTFLTLRHARIRDYLISRRINVDTDTGDSPLYLPSKAAAEVEASKLCLEALHDNKVLLSKFRFLTVYPATYLVQHLRSIDIDAIDDEIKLDLIDTLIDLFHNKTGHQALISAAIEEKDDDYKSFWPIWFSTNQNIKLVQNLFGAAIPLLDGHESSIVTWVRESATSAKRLFDPFAETLREKWLGIDIDRPDLDLFGETTANLNFAFATLVTLERMDDDGALPSEYCLYSELLMVFQTHDEILKTAEKSILPRDAKYYFGLSWILTSVGQSVQGHEYAKVAYEKDSNSWVAAWCVARSLMIIHDVDSAISWAKIAIKLNNSPSSPINAAIGYWMVRKNGIKGVPAILGNLKEVYSTHPDNKFVIHIYFTGLSLVNDSATLMESWNKSSKLVQEQHDMPLLNFLTDPFDDLNPWPILGCAYRSSRTDEERDRVLAYFTQGSAYNDRNASETDQINWYIKVARFHGAYVEDGFAKAYVILNNLMNKIKMSRTMIDPNVKVRLLSKAIQSLVELKHREALIARFERSTREKAIIDEIGHLASQIPYTHSAFASDENLAQAAQNPTLVHARLLYEYSPDNKKVREDVLREPLRHCCAMLEDSDARNDTIGLARLHHILCLAGEEQAYGDTCDILALYISSRVAGAPSHVSNDAAAPGSLPIANDSTNSDAAATQAISQLSIETPVLKLNLNQDILLTCEACSLRLHDSQIMHQCRVCTILYCESCMPRELAHQTLGRQCGKHHPFRKVWPVDLDKLSPHIIKIGGSYDLSVQWLQNLKEKWAL